MEECPYCGNKFCDQECPEAWAALNSGDEELEDDDELLRTEDECL